MQDQGSPNGNGNRATLGCALIAALVIAALLIYFYIIHSHPPFGAKNMNDDTQEKINVTAIQAARAAAQETVAPVVKKLDKIIGLITGYHEANISAESAKVATLKGESRNVKNGYTPE